MSGTNPLWLTRERRTAWPFPETAEEMRLHDAGLSWRELRVKRYTEGPDQAHIAAAAEGAEVRASSARRPAQLELAL